MLCDGAVHSNDSLCGICVCCALSGVEKRFCSCLCNQLLPSTQVYNHLTVKFPFVLWEYFDSISPNSTKLGHTTLDLYLHLTVSHKSGSLIIFKCFRIEACRTVAFRWQVRRGEETMRTFRHAGLVRLACDGSLLQSCATRFHWFPASL